MKFKTKMSIYGYARTSFPKKMGVPLQSIVPLGHGMEAGKHAQWLQTNSLWYPTGDVRTDNSGTDSRRTFKLAGRVTT